ncbi:hypothetical protein L9F63_010171, partial [Diploptera punctata]
CPASHEDDHEFRQKQDNTLVRHIHTPTKNQHYRTISPTNQTRPCPRNKERRTTVDRAQQPDNSSDHAFRAQGGWFNGNKSIVFNSILLFTRLCRSTYLCNVSAACTDQFFAIDYSIFFKMWTHNSCAGVASDDDDATHVCAIQVQLSNPIQQNETRMVPPDETLYAPVSRTK